MLGCFDLNSAHCLNRILSCSQFVYLWVGEVNAHQLVSLSSVWIDIQLIWTGKIISCPFHRQESVDVLSSYAHVSLEHQYGTRTVELMHLVKLFQIISIQCIVKTRHISHARQGSALYLETTINITGEPKSLLEFKIRNPTQLFTSSNDHNNIHYTFCFPMNVYSH